MRTLRPRHNWGLETTALWDNTRKPDRGISSEPSASRPVQATIITPSSGMGLHNFAQRRFTFKTGMIEIVRGNADALVSDNISTKQNCSRPSSLLINVVLCFVGLAYVLVVPGVVVSIGRRRQCSMRRQEPNNRTLKSHRSFILERSPILERNCCCSSFFPGVITIWDFE